MWKIFLNILSTILVLNFVTCDNYLKEQPSFLKVCKIHQDESEFTKCSTESVQRWFTYTAKNGVPGLKTLPNVDPFPVNKITFKEGGRSANFNGEFHNVKVHGLRDAVIVESRVSSKDYSWDTKILLPNLKVDGDYKIDGNILLIPLAASGKFSLEFKNMNFLLHTTVKLYEKGDFTFYNVTKCKVKTLDIEGLKVDFKNLFNGNKELEESTNALFNESWQDFFVSVKNPIISTVEEVIFTIFQQCFDYIPANFFVYDIPKVK